MNKFMFTLAVAASVSAGMVQAQEMGTATTATVQATVTVQEGSIAAEAEKATEDGGQAIIDQATAKGEALAQEAPSEDFVSADDQVTADLEKIGLSVGYDTDKKAIIQMGSASIKVEDPANDAGFMIAREQLSNIAYLNAKAEVIKAINAEFSAMDRVALNMDESFDENAEKVAQAKDSVEKKRAELCEVLAKYNEADAKAVGEITLNDRFGAFIDGVIKKIDKSYDPQALAAAKKVDAATAKADAEALMARAKELYAEYQTLKAAADKLPKDPAMESASSAKIMSKMPLLGSSIITQAESWDKTEKVYTVAMAIVWSPKLQMNAAKMGTGDFSATGKPGKFSKSAWVKAQDWRSMVGGRRFTDDKGRNLFVGISAVDLSGPVVKQNARKKIADTMAIKNVAMSLLSDLETYREASQNLKVYADDSKAAAQKLTENTSAKVDINLKGCMQLSGKTVKHPVTGRKIYVSAYYIDPSMAAAAGETLKKLYADAIRVKKYTKLQRDTQQVMQNTYNQVQNSAPDAVPPAATAPVVAPKPTTKVQTKVTIQTSTGAAGSKPGEPKGQSVGGTHSGGTLDGDF